MNDVEKYYIARDGTILRGIACVGKTGLGPLDAEYVLASDYDALRAENERLHAALAELTALVRGECPAILNEDSGGDAALAIEIDSLLE